MFHAYINEYLADKERYNIETLDRGLIAGSICPEQLMRQCNYDLGIDFLSIGYGMTEISPLCFQTRRTDSFQKQTTTVGLVHPHVEVKV